MSVKRSFVSILLAGPVIWLIGGLGWEYVYKTRRFSQEKAIISPVLARDPAMIGVKMNMFTADGTASLYGEVATKEDLDRLRSQMTTLFGEPRIKVLMYAVTVRKN